MKYQITKTIAFSRQVVYVEQTQTKLPYCRKGHVYGVDTVTQNSGVVYSDYFRLNIHYRFSKVTSKSAKLEVAADVEFVKPCLFKSKIESESWSGMKKYYELVEVEVQLEKNPVDEAEEKDVKRIKDNYNRKVATPNGNAASSTINNVKTSITNEAGILSNPQMTNMAFVLVLMAMAFLTLAMYKMSSALYRMEERLARVEAIMDRNSQFLDLFIEESLTRKQ